MNNNFFITICNSLLGDVKMTNKESLVQLINETNEFVGGKFAEAKRFKSVSRRNSTICLVGMLTTSIAYLTRDPVVVAAMVPTIIAFGRACYYSIASSTACADAVNRATTSSMLSLGLAGSRKYKEKTVEQFMVSDYLNKC